MSRSNRRSANAEAIAPWIALSVILLMWWAGARMIGWLRPHISTPIASSGRRTVAVLPGSLAIDRPAVDPGVKAARPNEPVLTADVTVTGADIAGLRARGLIVPVKNVSPGALVSSFNDARGGRKHEAIDILAPRGTDVIAVEDGTIAKFFTSAAGGLTIYEFDRSEEFVYYYAHLDSYADGLKEGDRIRQGEVIGHVGTTGNAPKNTPHLHFAISKLGGDHRWWGGTALDPFLVWRDPDPN